MMRKAMVLIPKDAHMPWPGGVLPIGCEAVDRDKQRVYPLRQRGIYLGRDGGMIRTMEPDKTPLTLALVDERVARDDGAIGDPHDQRRVVGPAVGIDQEARKGGEKSLHTKLPSET